MWTKKKVLRICMPFLALPGALYIMMCQATDLASSHFLYFHSAQSPSVKTFAFNCYSMINATHMIIWSCNNYHRKTVKAPSRALYVTMRHWRSTTPYPPSNFTICIYSHSRAALKYKNCINAAQSSSWICATTKNNMCNEPKTPQQSSYNRAYPRPEKSLLLLPAINGNCGRYRIHNWLWYPFGRFVFSQINFISYNL